jgi:glycosyltransferase involved in cell wall biosynthesis
MRVSLVLATVDRTDEPRRFLAALDGQCYRDFELIIVDQNPDARLAPVLQPYRERFRLIHVRSARGAARARNVGLQHITGDIVAFPDDDCWYPPDLLARVVRFFCDHPEWDGLTARSVGEDGRPSVLFWHATPGQITFHNVWWRSICYSIFLRRSVVEQVGDFDEEIGPGAGTQWGAGEETDYLLRAMRQGARLFYDPGLLVGHPHLQRDRMPGGPQRAFRYGAGVGHVLRKHRYPLWYVAYQWARPLGGAALCLARGQVRTARYHFATFCGRVYGWLAPA